MKNRSNNHNNKKIRIDAVVHSSCSSINSIGHWSYSIGDIFIQGISPKDTHQKMILTAAIKLLESNTTDSLRIISCNMYLIEGLNKNVKIWLQNGWRKANGTPIANLLEWQKLVALAINRDIVWEWHN